MIKPLSFRAVLNSAALWPATSVYLAGVFNIVLVASGMISVNQGIVLFAILTMLIVLLAVEKELNAVHILVNSQHDALIARVDQLITQLSDADVDIPPSDAK